MGMKIGIFTDTYFPQVSGVATSIQTLKEELEDNGHEVTIFTTTDPHANEEEEKDIVRFTSIPFFSFKDRRVAIGGKHQALKMARQLGLEMIHTQTEFSLGLTGKYVAEQMRIPCVHTYHTLYERYLHYVAKGKILRPSHVKIMSKYFCNQTDGIIVPSEKTKQILLSYGVSQKIAVIPTGVNLKKLSAKSDRDIRCELNISAHNIVLLSLSRLAEEKNIEALLHAMPEILRRYPSAKMLVVGDGPNRMALEQLSEDLSLKEALYFVGEVKSSEVNAYYQAADLYVNASSSETQGLTYIEAIAAGTAIIAKDCSYTNMLIYSGDFGATYHTDEELAQTVIQYLEKSHSENQEAIERKHLLQAISSEVFAEEVMDFYETVLDTYTWDKEFSS